MTSWLDFGPVLLLQVCVEVIGLSIEPGHHFCRRSSVLVGVEVHQVLQVRLLCLAVTLSFWLTFLYGAASLFLFFNNEDGDLY